METLTKILRLALFGVFLALLLGTKNVQAKPLLWAFLALVVLTRGSELFHPEATALSHWHRSDDLPRWVSWLAGLAFLTNLVLPILDYRYRGEVSWASPLPAAPWWSWLALLFLFAGLALRLRTRITAGPAAAGRQQSKRQPAAKIKPQPESVPASAQTRLAFELGSALTYTGVAVLCTSLWAFLALFVVVLPVLWYRRRALTRAVPT